MSDQPFDPDAILADIAAAISDGSLTSDNCHKIGMSREQFAIAASQSPLATFDPEAPLTISAILADIPGAIDAGVLTQDNASMIGVSRGGFALILSLIQSGGGGGGGDFLPLAGGTMDTDAEIAFDNGSRIHQTPNANGIDQVCSIDYVHRWSNGSLYILDQSNGIRQVQYGLTVEPGASYDETLGYMVGSRYIKDDGTSFICTDASEGAAEWEEEGGGGGGGGGGNISDPDVAYITSDGSDAHGVIGNPHKPFLTGTAAFGEGARSFNFGTGVFDLDTGGIATSIFICGRGIAFTQVDILHNGQDGNIGTDGAPGVVVDTETGGTQGTDGGVGGTGTNGSPFGDLYVNSDHSATINITAISGMGGQGGPGGLGGDGTDGDGNGGNGGDGGTGGAIGYVEMHSVTGSTDIQAGAGGPGGQAPPGAANGNPGAYGDGAMLSKARFCYLVGSKNWRALATVHDDTFYSDG